MTAPAPPRKSCDTCGAADGSVRVTWPVETPDDRRPLCQQCRYELSLVVPVDCEVRS